MTLRYTLEIHIPEDPDGVIVKLGRDDLLSVWWEPTDGRTVARHTDALVTALQKTYDSLALNLENELNG